MRKLPPAVKQQFAPSVGGSSFESFNVPNLKTVTISTKVVKQYFQSSQPVQLVICFLSSGKKKKIVIGPIISWTGGMKRQKADNCKK